MPAGTLLETVGSHEWPRDASEAFDKKVETVVENLGCSVGLCNH